MENRVERDIAAFWARHRAALSRDGSLAKSIDYMSLQVEIMDVILARHSDGRDFNCFERAAWHVFRCSRNRCWRAQHPRLLREYSQLLTAFPLGIAALLQLCGGVLHMKRRLPDAGNSLSSLVRSGMRRLGTFVVSVGNAIEKWLKRHTIVFDQPVLHNDPYQQVQSRQLFTRQGTISFRSRHVSALVDALDFPGRDRLEEEAQIFWKNHQLYLQRDPALGRDHRYWRTMCSVMDELLTRYRFHDQLSILEKHSWDKLACSRAGFAKKAGPDWTEYISSVYCRVGITAVAAPMIWTGKLLSQPRQQRASMPRISILESLAGLLRAISQGLKVTGESLLQARDFFFPVFHAPTMVYGEKWAADQGTGVRQSSPADLLHQHTVTSDRIEKEVGDTPARQQQVSGYDPSAHHRTTSEADHTGAIGKPNNKERLIDSNRNSKYPRMH